MSPSGIHKTFWSCECAATMYCWFGRSGWWVIISLYWNYRIFVLWWFLVFISHFAKIFENINTIFFCRNCLEICRTNGMLNIVNTFDQVRIFQYKLYKPMNMIIYYKPAVHQNLYLPLSLSLLISDGRSTGENRSTRNITEIVWKVNLNLSLFTASKRSWGKVMFSQVPSQERGGRWVSLVPGPFWGAVCLGVCQGEGEGQVCPGGLEPHPFPGYMGPWILRDTVHKRAVRILLECLLFITAPQRLCFHRRLSVHEGCLGLCPGGSVRGGSVWGGPLSRGVCQGEPPGERLPLYGNERAVCILLECILVSCIWMMEYVISLL